MNEEQRCPISGGPIVDLAALACEHIFEFEGIKKWIEDSPFVPACPVCKAQIVDYATHDVLVRRGRGDAVIFSRLQPLASLENSEGIGAIYTGTLKQGLTLISELADKGKLTTPQDTEFANAKKMQLFSIKQNKSNLPTLRTEFGEVVSFYKNKMAS